MSLSLLTGLTLLVLGIVVWLFGRRMWILGAGAGALLGFGLLRLFPGLADGFIGFLIVAGMAVLFGVLGFIGKAFAKLFTMILGFVIGGGLALAFFDSLGLNFGFFDWILALVVGVIVAIIFARFLDWALIIFAALLGSMLIARGGLVAFPNLLTGTTGTIIVLILTAIGIYYQYRQSKPASK
jgi:hypothetical protein